jgi:hypothetical protein
MSHLLPVESFSIQPEAVEALATELAVLAAELADEAGQVRASAASFPVALGGDEGWHAGATATAWGRLQEMLGARADAIADTLAAAADAYRAEDAALAGRSAPAGGAGRRPPR